MSIVRAPVVKGDGTMGIRGWRGLCSKCLWLGPVSPYNKACDELHAHSKTCAGSREPVLPPRRLLYHEVEDR